MYQVKTSLIEMECTNFLKLVDMFVGLRLDSEPEMQGLDLVLHDERGYDL